MPITLLDGGTGSELRAQGVEVPSHITSIWSAQALLDAPDAVVKVHRDYIEAGADVISVNNYAVTPPLLRRRGLEDQLESLTRRAVELARHARDQSHSGRPVRIAGSIPPLDTSYRADLVGSSEQITSDYRRLVEILAPEVDLLLCETMASAREAVAALGAARESDREVWLSFTLQGDWPGHLPSGETLAEVMGAVAGLGADAHLVNCAAANLVTDAIPRLRELCEGPIGGYANATLVAVCTDDQPSDLDDVHVESGLEPEAYSGEVGRWIEAGATIVGGCCSTRPAHTAAMRRQIDQRLGGDSLSSS